MCLSDMTFDYYVLNMSVGVVSSTLLVCWTVAAGRSFSFRVVQTTVNINELIDIDRG